MAECPICQLRCVERSNVDEIICPEHGVFNGLELLRIRHMTRIDGLIEIMAIRAHNEIRRMTMDACRQIFGNSAEYFLRLHHG